MADHISSFEFKPGRRIGRHYDVVRLLGRGTEGEVYRIRDLDTGIHRAAKIYYPHRDPDRLQSVRHARMLDQLRTCPIVLQYHHREMIEVDGQQAVALISELCEGHVLQRWIERHRDGRLPAYTALHVLYELACGLEAIHALGQYHADVHTENILVRPRGVRLSLKLIDFYDWGPPAPHKQQQDLRDAVRVFYDCLGGREHYARQSPPIRHICAGLRHDLLERRFPSLTVLRQHLERFDWDTLE